MIKKRRAFLQMMALELDDLYEDIKVLIDQYTKKHDAEIISNYVFMENITVMKNELFGVDGYSETLAQINVDEYENLDALIKRANDLLIECITKNDMVHSVEILVKRKINKVINYIQ